MNRRLSRLLAAALAGVLAVGLSGCKTGTDDEMTPRPTDTATAIPVRTPETAPVVRLPVAAPGSLDTRSSVLWAQGSTIHLGPRTIDVAPLQIDALAAGWHGVYFLSGGTLWFTDLSQARETRLTGVTGLVSSVDRRYLGLIDPDHGPQDDYGTPTAAVLVFDTSTGERVLRSYAGMGDAATQRLGTLYREHPPTAIALADDAFFVRTPTGLRRYALDSGHSQRAAQLPADWRQSGPEQEYRIVTTSPFVVQAAGGADRRVTGAGAEFTPVGWLSPTRLYGVAGRRVLTCDLGTASCVRTALAGGPARGPVVLPSSSLIGP